MNQEILKQNLRELKTRAEAFKSSLEETETARAVLRDPDVLMGWNIIWFIAEKDIPLYETESPEEIIIPLGHNMIVDYGCPEEKRYQVINGIKLLVYLGLLENASAEDIRNMAPIPVKRLVSDTREKFGHPVCCYRLPVYDDLKARQKKAEKLINAWVNSGLSFRGLTSIQVMKKISLKAAMIMFPEAGAGKDIGNILTARRLLVQMLMTRKNGKKYLGNSNVKKVLAAFNELAKKEAIHMGMLDRSEGIVFPCASSVLAEKSGVGDGGAALKAAKFLVFLGLMEYPDGESLQKAMTPKLRLKVGMQKKSRYGCSMQFYMLPRMKNLVETERIIRERLDFWAEKGLRVERISKGLIETSFGYEEACRVYPETKEKAA